MFDWSETAVSTLKQMVADGVSYSIIGKALGISRGAAIGKAARLGLSGDRKPRADDLGGLRARVHLNGGNDPFHMPRTSLPPSKRLTLLQLTAHTCRWPIGDIGHPDFYFCGAYTGSPPYCRHHKQMSVTQGRYQPGSFINRVPTSTR